MDSSKKIAKTKTKTKTKTKKEGKNHRPLAMR
jgi:hypothetical protein